MAVLDKQLKILFFTPHPDDIEIGCPFLFYQALAKGYKVVEVVMTNGEFGTFRKEFKGRRIARIRAKELTQANQVFEKYTHNKIKVIRMGYVDGYLPLNKNTIERVKDHILKEGADIILAPDPFFPQDYHFDHINTGKLIFHAVDELNRIKHPLVLFYYSIKADFYIQCRWHDFKIVETALSAHKSQNSPFAVKFIMTFYKKLSIFRHLLERGRCSESYRKQDYRTGKTLAARSFSFRERLIHYILSPLTLSGVHKLHETSPEEVGLDRHQIYLDY